MTADVTWYLFPQELMHNLQKMDTLFLYEKGKQTATKGRHLYRINDRIKVPIMPLFTDTQLDCLVIYFSYADTTCIERNVHDFLGFYLLTS